MKREHVARLELAWVAGQRRVNFAGRYDFVDRGRGCERLVVLLAGHKPHLWDHVLPRLARFAPPDADVCVASPKVDRPELRAAAAEHGWSYLATNANYPSLAQNLAIRLHPEARWIYKLDEDVFIGGGFFDGLLAAYERARAAERWWPGFVAPLLNVNGYGYRPFLEAVDAAGEYRERFGPLIQAAGPLPATEDGEAARFLWERSLPFDDRVADFAAGPPAISAVPHKFSIGAILLERSFWDAIGGLKVRPFVGGIGVDEQALCSACVTFSRAMLVAHDVFAGHFSFGPQDAAMRAALPELAPGLALQAPALP